MPKFTLKVDHAVTLFSPEGRPGAMLVEPGDVIDVPGELVTSRPAPQDDEPEPTPLPEDAYTVANNGEEKTWPHSMWELVEDKPKKVEPVKAPAVKES
ncbi:hypothetical protein ACWEF6_02590 [Amycolatopsis sp. NPDC004772]